MAKWTCWKLLDIYFSRTIKGRSWVDVSRMARRGAALRESRRSLQISKSPNRRRANYAWALHRRQEIPIRELRRGTVVNHRYLPTVSPAMHRNRPFLPIQAIPADIFLRSAHGRTRAHAHPRIGSVSCALSRGYFKFLPSFFPAETVEHPSRNRRANDRTAAAQRAFVSFPLRTEDRYHPRSGNEV